MFYFDVNVFRGATTFSELGVQFLGLGYYYPSTEKIRQVYPVWCSRLHNHTLFIKKLRYVKSWGVRPNFGEVRTSSPRPLSGCAHECITISCMHFMLTRSNIVLQFI